MTRDKQLLSVQLDQVIEKRRLEQALNAKEFAVLAGISYSAARTWFRLPGFPAFCGVVFWQDFAQWRNAQAGARNANRNVPERSIGEIQHLPRYGKNVPARVAQLLAEAD